MIQDSDVFMIGRTGKIHGLKGEIVFTFTDEVFDRTKAPYWFLSVEGILVPFFITSYRYRSGSTVLVKMDGIDSAEDARILQNRDVYYPRKYGDKTESQDSLDKWDLFVGFSIIDYKSNNCIGIIKAVDASTANVFFSVEKEGQEYFVPAAEDLFKEVDKAGKILKMLLPEGLLGLKSN